MNKGNKDKLFWVFYDGTVGIMAPSQRIAEIRSAATTLFGYKCVVCGDVVGKKSSTLMVLHRIDYDTDNIDVMNIVPLCPHCHATTLKEKDFWKDYILQLPEVKTIHDGIVEFRRKQK